MFICFIHFLMFYNHSCEGRSTCFMKIVYYGLFFFIYIMIVGRFVGVIHVVYLISMLSS
jgi:hypothetical protein